MIYGNWSAYDELSDQIPLTEELAMRQFSEMLRLREQGVSFDAYLMDAFWFAPDGGYRTWRKPNWPDGPGRWLDACARHGILPGLWFTANTLSHLECAPKWRDSADANNWGLCCFHGGFLADYLDVLDSWYRQGLRLFKLDFADFSAAPPHIKDAMSEPEIRQRNADALRSGLSAFRGSHPDAAIMAFNGFEFRDYMDRTDRPLEKVLDLRWLEVFDCVYSGDPRPADVPCVPFWRSVDVYGDHTTRLLAHSGVPLGKIDNCGFMAGPTGTCYWRGKAMWKGMLILTLARGGDFNVLYGELGQFDDVNGAWMAEVQRLFEDAVASGESVPFGGLPGIGEPYGWALPNGLCVVVNPQPAPETITCPLGLRCVLFRDAGFEPILADGSVTLGPYQMALLGVNRPGLGIQEDCVSEVRVPAAYRVVQDLGSRVVIETTPGDLRLIVRKRDAEGRLVRNYLADRSIAETLAIRARQGETELDVSLQHDRIVWSGMSWGAAEVVAEGQAPVTFEIEAREPEVTTLEIEVWRA